MAILKDLIVTGAARHIADSYFATIKSGTWNGSPITDTYISSATTWHGKQDKVPKLGSTTKPVYVSAAGTFTECSAYPTKTSWNYDDVYVKLSGSTMTGVLKLKGEQYNGNTGLDANNSDITKVNSIYTADTADNTAEGIRFYRDASHWDSLTANGGKLYFMPNDTLVGTAFVNAKEVYHTGNLSPMTTSHAANGITSNDIINWNSVYNWYSATTDPSTDAKIDKWFEIENFLDGVTNAKTLTEMLMQYVTLDTAQTITGAKSFTGGITVKGTGNAIININGVSHIVDYAHIFVNGNRPLVLQNGYGNVSIGNIPAPTEKLEVDGNIKATKFIGNLQGNCSGSSSSCTGNAATATLASSLTVKIPLTSSAKSLSSANWVEIADCSSTTDYPIGSYAIQVIDTGTKTNYYSGIISLTGATGRLDEVPLHVSMGTGSDTEIPRRIFIATETGKIKASSQDDTATNHILTIKLAKII